MIGEWAADAACAGHPQRWWFPTAEQLRQRKEDPYLLARMVCVRCPVIADCLRHALDMPEHDGMWAALTPEQREPLRRRGQRVAA